MGYKTALGARIPSAGGFHIPLSPRRSSPKSPHPRPGLYTGIILFSAEARQGRTPFPLPSAAQLLLRPSTVTTNARSRGFAAHGLAGKMLPEQRESQRSDPIDAPIQSASPTMRGATLGRLPRHRRLASHWDTTHGDTSQRHRGGAGDSHTRDGRYAIGANRNRGRHANDTGEAGRNRQRRRAPFGSQSNRSGRGGEADRRRSHGGPYPAGGASRMVGREPRLPSARPDVCPGNNARLPPDRAGGRPNPGVSL
jgi:hypothetical protein